jgi:PKD repeat protein
MRTPNMKSIFAPMVHACMMLACMALVCAIVVDGEAIAQTGPTFTCCPEFKLKVGNAPCERDQSPDGGGSAGNGNPTNGPNESMCQNGTNTFLVTPNLPGYTYSWTIGGTSTGTITATGNPLSVTWGTGTLGTVSVTITSIADPSCTATILQSYTLRPGPTALFTMAPNDTVCVSTPVQFTNASIGGTSWTWNFGDGTILNGGSNPTHAYASTGTYIVTLTVTTAGSSTSSGHGEPPKPECPCTSVFRDTIVVINGNGLQIIEQGCKRMLCEGDTSRYCSSVTCGPYTWSVNGGTIVTPNPSTQSCIDVVWNSPPTSGWPSVSLSIPASCTGTCGNSATVIAPVVYPNLPIDGPTVACVGSSTTYSLPTLPGTLYSWSLPSGGGTITGPTGNNEQITVAWGSVPGTYLVQCAYYNPITKCGGMSTLPVTVKDRFQIYGTTASCLGCTGYYSASSGSAIWTVVDQSLNVIAGPSAPLTSFSYVFPVVPGAGTYTVTATPQFPANFCNASASVTVNVAPVPVLTQPVGPLVVCPGSTHSYTTTTSIPGTPVQWTVTGPNGSGTIVPTGADNTTAQITFSGTGPYTINVSQPCANWCTSGNAPALTVTTVPPPGPITPTTPVCIDAIVSYSIPSPAAGVAYTWTITPAAAGTVIAGQGGGTVSIQWHGGSMSPPTITVTNCAGSSTSSPITINIPTPIAITPSGSLCGPGGMTLTAPSGLTNYLWSTNATTSSITNVSSPGTYWVEADQNGCRVRATYTIPVSPLSVHIYSPGPFHYCFGQTISTPIYYSVVGSPTIFNWKRNGLTVATGTSFTATQAGTYTLQVIQNGCVALSNPIVIVQDSCDTCRLTNIGTIAITSPTTGTYCNPVSYSATFTQGSNAWTYSPITWSFGNGGSATGPTATHTYANIGIYVVTASVTVTDPVTGHQCVVTASVAVTIPTVTDFMWSVGCGTITLTDLTQTINTNPISSWSWTVSPSGTFSNPSAQNPTLTVTSSGAYTVTLTTTAGPCTTSQSHVINVTLPAPPPITIAPNPGCVGQPMAFTTATITGGSYNWQFGDSYFSYTQSPAHAYAAPGIYTVTLTVTDANGCTATSTLKDTVNAVPSVTVTPATVAICPGTPTPLTATGCASCTYQWYKDGVAIPSATANPYNATTSGSYYVVATSTTTGCAVPSDTAVVTLLPSPIAKITGSSAFCFGPGGNTGQTLGNYYGNNPAYTYAWSSSSGDIVLTQPTQGITGVQLTTGTPSPYYTVFLTVTDIATGCSASDTLCIYPSRKPTASITGGGCAGIPHTLTASVTPPPSISNVYAYTWSTGETTPSITTSIAGTYSVVITNVNTGCSDVAFGAIIEGPDLSLFPIGCDTLCTNGKDTVVMPLPIAPPSIGAYTIQWYDNGNPISGATAWTLPVQGSPPLAPGLHNLSVVVVGPAPSTCADTAGTFALFVKTCDSCGCSGAQINEVGWAIGASNEYMPVGGSGTIPQVVKCDSIKLTASFACAKPCSSLVVTHLYDSSGALVATQTGMPAVFVAVPGMSGTYTLVIYGICGNDTCDVDTIRVKIECPPEPPCSVCPPEFHKQISLSMTPKPPTLVSVGGSTFNQINAAVTFNTGTLQLVSVGAQIESYTLEPGFRDCITCENRPAGWGSITGTPLGGITPINVGLAGDPLATDNSFLNPREIVWSSATPFTLNPGSTTLSFYLPALANVPCCELKGKICVRFFFRDVNCRVCDTLICFEFGKDSTVAKCDCGKWRGVTFSGGIVDVGGGDSPGGGRGAGAAKMAVIAQPLACGATYTVAKKATFSFTAGYDCSTKDCAATYAWTLTKPGGGVQQQGTGASATISGGLAPGTYTLTFSATCGGVKCAPCSITIVVK